MASKFGCKYDAMGLSPCEAIIYGLLNGQGEVPVRKLYIGYYARQPEGAGHGTTRRQQQALAWVIAAANKRLRVHDKQIRPGETVGTYRIYEL